MTGVHAAPGELRAAPGRQGRLRRQGSKPSATQGHRASQEDAEEQGCVQLGRVAGGGTGDALGQVGTAGEGDTDPSRTGAEHQAEEFGFCAAGRGQPDEVWEHLWPGQR